MTSHLQVQKNTEMKLFFVNKSHSLDQGPRKKLTPGNINDNTNNQILVIVL